MLHLCNRLSLRPPTLSHALSRPFSSHRLPPKSKNPTIIREGVAADPDPVPEAAHEVWTRQQQGLPYVPPGPVLSDFYRDPMYTPLIDPQTGLGIECNTYLYRTNDCTFEMARVRSGSETKSAIPYFRLGRPDNRAYRRLPTRYSNSMDAAERSV
jgi:hypothetical protein